MKVLMTWGTGPDVVLSLEGTVLHLNEEPDLSDKNNTNGSVSKGNVNLTADEAYRLGANLMKAANLARELEEGYIKKKPCKDNNIGWGD